MHPTGTPATLQGSFLCSSGKGAPTLCSQEGLGRGSRDALSPTLLIRGSEETLGSKLSRKLGENSRPTRFFPGMARAPLFLMLMLFTMTSPHFPPTSTPFSLACPPLHQHGLHTITL